MLVNAPLGRKHLGLHVHDAINTPYQNVRTGIYIGDLNLDHRIDTNALCVHEEQHFQREEELRLNYGVCDDIEQVLNHYRDLLDRHDLYFCISFYRLERDTEPPQNGWRWEKWGPYIGKQQPQRRYLFDEPLIESVYVFQLIQLQPTSTWTPERYT